MPKSLEQLQNSKAGATAESNGFGGAERAVRPGGLYRHKENGDEIIVKTHPKFGDSQASAAERVGYEFVRPAKKEELHDNDLLAAGDNPLVGETAAQTGDDLKGLKARANEQDRLIKELQDKLAGKDAEDTKGAADNDVKAQAKDEAKDAAVEGVAERTGNSALDDETETVDKKEEETTTTPSENQTKSGKPEAKKGK